MDKLTQKVLLAQGGVSDLGGLIKEVGEMVYRKLLDYWKLSREVAHEFILKFYPKIPTYIHKFRYTGAEFSHYILTCVRFMLNKSEAYRKVSIVVHGLNFEPHDEHFLAEAPVATDSLVLPQIDSLFYGLKRKKQRCYYFLALRYSWFLKDEQIDYLVNKIGLSKRDLLEKIDRIRSMLQPRYAKKCHFADRRSFYLLRLYTIRRKLAEESRPQKRERLKKLEEFVQTKLKRTKTLYDSISLQPSLSMLSEVTGVPRTTIAGMYQRFFKHERRRLSLNN